MNTITPDYIRNNWPRHEVNAHKGDNGRLLIIGGSLDYYGAPILMGLAALRAGCDLVHMYVPACNFDITRKQYPDFIVQKYADDYFSVDAAREALSLAEKCTAVAIGPGLSTHTGVAEAVTHFVQNSTKPMAVDADAILHYSELRPGIVVTPHAKEFERLTGERIDTLSPDEKAASVMKWSEKLGMTILLKGPVDIIASESGKYSLNETGNAHMTIGGTGDVLAGTVGSLLAQGVESYVAATLAAFIVGLSGDRLQTEKGSGFLASEVAHEIPSALKEILAS